MRLPARFSAAIATAVLVACGSTSTSPGGFPAVCNTATDITLAVGQYQIFDAINQASCVKLPGAATAQEYLVVEYSGAGTVTNLGNSTPYGFIANNPTATASAGILASEIPVSRLFTESTPNQFHMMLRRRERDMARSGAMVLGAPPAPTPVPVFGDHDSLWVCKTLNCSSFTKIGATVR